MKIAIIIIMIAFSGILVTNTSFLTADGAGPTKRLHLTVLEPTGQPASVAICKVSTDVDPEQFDNTTNRGTIHFVVSSTSTIAFVTCSSPIGTINSFPIPLIKHTTRATITLDLI